MYKKFFLFFNIFILNIFSSQDPFEKIIITSKRAVCNKDLSQNNNFIFKYIDSVLVKFADGSNITCDELEITFDAGKINKDLKKQDLESNKDLDRFKKIYFKNNVKIINQNRKIDADNAQLYLATKKCFITGNVKIVQEKSDSKDIPIKTECNSVELDLQNQTMSFQGDLVNPVSTVIEFGDQIKLLDKKSGKDKKYKILKF